MKRHIALETKEALDRQALSGRGKRLTEIALANNIGYSTLQRWVLNPGWCVDINILW